HRVRFVDLDSTNGTTVNGVAAKEIWLSGGETIQMGDTTIAVRRKGPRVVELPKATRFGGLAGESAAMRKLYPTLERLAAEDGALRVVAATWRDLGRAVDDGHCDAALFRFLATSRVELPPLRERVGDVGLLARRFWLELGGTGGLPEDFLPRLADHKWPGNVR